MVPHAQILVAKATSPGHYPIVRVVECIAREAGSWAGAALIAERWLAVPSEGSLHVLDLDATGGDTIDLTTSSPRGLVARIDEVACAAFRDDLLLVGDRSGTLRRIDPAAGFRETSSWRTPDDLRTEASPCATWLQLSASGRFACATLAKGLHLVELASSRAHAIPRTSPAGHASFTRLPSGDEVLFASLPSYMGVSMYDCASGSLLQRFRPTSAFDFCHVRYELSAEGDRLFAFGCVWAGPYAPRIYDAGPWVSGPPLGDSPPAKPFEAYSLPVGPLRLLFEHEHEVGQLGDALPIDAQRARDGCVTSVTVVDHRDVPARGSEDDADVREDRTPSQLAIYDRLQELAAQGEDAAVIRRVDPLDGRVVGLRVAPCSTGSDRRLHVLDEHRVLAVGARIDLIDGATGASRCLGVTDTSSDAITWTGTLVTRDLGTLVLVRHLRRT